MKRDNPFLRTATFNDQNLRKCIDQKLREVESEIFLCQSVGRLFNAQQYQMPLDAGQYPSNTMTVNPLSPCNSLESLRCSFQKSQWLCIFQLAKWNNKIVI